MTSRKTTTAIVLLVLLVAGACILWFWQPPESPQPSVEQPSRGGAARNTPGGGRKSSNSKPIDAAGSQRLGGNAAEEARTNFNSVEVELEPDMAAFSNQELPTQLDEATAAAMANGSLAGEDLLKALAVMVRSGEEGTKKAWEAVRNEQDPAAKLAVLRAAAAESDAVAGEILKEGIRSKHPQLRYEAVALVEGLRGGDDDTRREVLAEASTADANTASTALGQLSEDTRKADLAVMFRYLDHPDPAVADSARGTIDFLINEEFKSAADAQAWWQAHAGNFDDELQEKE